jgi:predicted nuclease of predicted toxin-antitoxin system
MRLCVNENLPGDCVAALRATGHDVLWIRESIPGAADDEVLARALTESRLLITLDKDFGTLVFKRGRTASNGIVLFRISQPSASAVSSTISRILALRDDWRGHFSVVDDRTVRMRALP